MRNDAVYPAHLSPSESRAYYAAAAKDQNLTPRQVRGQGMNPLPSWTTILSEEQDAAIQQAEAASRANAENPYFNGEDVARRLASHG
jgi:hypothetical protein